MYVSKHLIEKLLRIYIKNSLKKTITIAVEHSVPDLKPFENISSMALDEFLVIRRKLEYDDKVQAAISGNKEILQTGRTSVDQLEHDLKKAIADEKKSINPKFHGTEKEEELSFNFSQKWSSPIQKYEDAIYSETAKVSTLDSIDKNIEQCHKAIDAFEAFRNYCYKKSKGDQIYFDDIW
jgi:polyphosphate kinase